MHRNDGVIVLPVLFQDEHVIQIITAICSFFLFDSIIRINEGKCFSKYF
jgi:hypothetical protein